MPDKKERDVIKIDKDVLDGFKQSLIQNRKQYKNLDPREDAGKRSELDRLIKESVVDFFEDTGYLYIDNDIKLTHICNVPAHVREDIKNRGNAIYTNLDYQNMSWATINIKDIGYDIWLIFWHETKGVYVFELPEEDEFKLTDFKVTTKTQLNNDGYKAPNYDWKTKMWWRGTRGQRPQNQGADIVIDFNNEDRFQEVLGCTNDNCGDGNFTQYLRAKIDFKTDELSIYPEKNSVSEEEYGERRDQALNKLSDNEQKPAAATDAKASLINAGAGCGKTTTLIGRIIYLIKEGKIKSPDDLLLVAFNRKNRKDFRKSLKRLGMAEYAKRSAHTFHSLGCSIIRTTGRQFKCLEAEENDNLLDIVLRLFENPDYEPNNPLLVKECKGFSDTVKQKINETNWLKNMFLWSSLNLPNLSARDPNTGEPNPEYVRLMGLYEEVIPNEEQRLLAAKLDKYGVCLDVDNYDFDDDDVKQKRVLNYLLLSGYKKDEITINKYYRYIQIRPNGQIYWRDYDCSGSFDGVKTVVPPINDTPLSEKEIDDIIDKAVIRARMEEFRELAKQFISLCKVYNIPDLDALEQEILKKNPSHEKYISGFFKLIHPVYSAYDTFLKKYNYLDFNDMINQATKILAEDLKRPEYDNRFKYKYIFVDEFQDVAEDNFKLIKALRDRSNASVTCVGDDWQAIYSWRGSDLRFFKDIKNQFGLTDEDYKEFQVTQTHRYGKDLVDVSNNFIRSNDPNEKVLKAIDDKKETKLVKWTGNWDELITEIKKEYGTNISLKVLQRRKRDAKAITGKDAEQLAISLQKEFIGIDESRKDTTDVLTIRKAKGLEADVVIVLDLKEQIFPSSKAPDIILAELQKLYNSSTDTYAEERRLFYVAMTRAKKACYFFNPSGKFWKELIENPNNEGKIQSKPVDIK